MSSFAADTVFRKTAELLESEVDAEIVALDVQKGQCYGLNEVGARVWRLLDTPQSIGQICAALVDEYEVEADTCRQEVERLLTELQSEGLVEAAKG